MHKEYKHTHCCEAHMYTHIRTPQVLYGAHDRKCINDRKYIRIKITITLIVSFCKSCNTKYIHQVKSVYSVCACVCERACARVCVCLCVCEYLIVAKI